MSLLIILLLQQSEKRDVKALILQEDKSISVREAEKPILKKGQALIRIKAAALNHRELWISKGLYPGMQLPCILGADGTGMVVDVYPESDHTLMDKEVIIYPAYDWGGDGNRPTRSFRVLGMPDPGTMAEYIAVPIENLVQKPTYLSWEEAAAIPVASITAWRALVRHGRIEKGSQVLITGIGGGVAQAAMDIALAHGASVYVTSSGPQKIAAAIERGASAGVNYKDEDWHLQLKEISQGIDIVIDSSPAPNLDDYLKLLNYGARIVAYGSTGNRKTTLNISKFFLRHIQFIGTAMGSPEEFKDLLQFMESHEIRPVIDSVFSFADALLAFDSLAKGQQIGKVVINDF